ncbi:MAG: type II and III secretion system protein family protein [Pseudomonadota bacterium]|nr:type II and III secretion system protein family protein [Pseudomonadota bacterium]
MDRCLRQQRLSRARRVIGSVALAASAGAALAAAPAKVAAPPAAEAARGESGLRCSGEAAKPANLQLQLGKSAMLRLPEAVLYRSVGNPDLVRVRQLAHDTLYLAGIDVGSTNMIIQGRSGACSMIDIVVSMDATAFQATLASVLPDEHEIRVVVAADSLVLTGTVADGAAVLRAGELAAAFVRRPLQPLVGIGANDNTGVAKAADARSALHAELDPGATGSAKLLMETRNNGGAAAGGAGVRVINMLNVRAPQQVMLEVKIAEVSKTLLEKLEAGATLKYASGSWATTLLSNFLTGSAGGLFDARKSNGNQLTLEAQKQDGLVRILAEPNVMAISGQEGSFLAGGRIFIPVAQDNNKVTLEEKEFGVGLRFTPTVLHGGRINLRVANEVSELSREGAGFTAAGVPGGSILPLITTRRASTTVQLYDGQSFAIGGLIKNNLTTTLKGLPLLGEVPILGALFRSTDYQQDRSELVFVITAHLVKPLPPNYTLPTDGVVAPSPAELMLGGRLEGRAAPAAANPPASLAADAARGFELK